VATIVFAITADWSEHPKPATKKGPEAHASVGPGSVLFTVDY
jgi:hypothetical protein